MGRIPSQEVGGCESSLVPGSMLLWVESHLSHLKFLIMSSNMNLKIHSDLVEAVVALKNNPPEQE